MQSEAVPNRPQSLSHKCRLRSVAHKPYLLPHQSMSQVAVLLTPKRCRQSQILLLVWAILHTSRSGARLPTRPTHLEQDAANRPQHSRFTTTKSGVSAKALSRIPVSPNVTLVLSSDVSLARFGGPSRRVRLTNC